MDPQETPLLSGVTNAQKPAQKNVQNPSKIPDFHQKWRRFTLILPQGCQRLVTSLHFCGPAPSILRSSYPSAHKEAEATVLLFTRSISLYFFVLSSLCISHVSKPKSHIIQTCRKTRADHLHNITLLSENTDFHTDTIYGGKCTFLISDVSCRNILQGKTRPVENVCGNGANRLKKAQKHLAASLLQFI